MSKNNRKKLMKLALEHYIEMIESYFPLENARFIIFYDYEFSEEEKILLQVQMLKILEDKVRVLPG